MSKEVKPIILHDLDNSQDYTLDYSRKSAALLEASGFRVDLMISEPNVMIPLIWKFSFVKNHPTVSQKVIDKLFDETPNMDKAIARLGELYAETTNTLLDKEKVGNVNWE